MRQTSSLASNLAKASGLSKGETRGCSVWDILPNRWDALD